MTEAVLTQNNPMLSVQWPDLVAAAERVMTRALDLCAQRMGLADSTAAALCVRQGNAVARMHCCAGMTKQVAKALGSSDRNVRAVYTIDYDVAPQELCSGGETPDTSMVRLLVWTEHRSAAFDSLVSSWDRALVEACKNTIGIQQHTSLIDVHVIDDAEVGQHFRCDGCEHAPMRLAAYLLKTSNEAVEITYTRPSA